MHQVRVWDLPTRLFHWALAASVIALVVSGSLGGNFMEIHLKLGYLVLSLLLFRLVWGVLGGRWSRFCAFVYSPRTVLRYLQGRGTPEHDVGHTPLGALSVFAMLAALLAQAVTGLISDDEIAFFGPLTRLVSNETVQFATGYHTEFGKPLVIVLVGLHLLALAYYKWIKGQRLVQAMVTGDKILQHPAADTRDGWAQRLFALALFMACAALVAWVVNLGQL